MSTTATATTTGKAQVLATYDCDEGQRQLLGQRVNETVHISDIPTAEQGRVYLVDEGCQRPLEGLGAEPEPQARAR